jgi:hypothetical protein
MYTSENKAGRAGERNEVKLLADFTHSRWIQISEMSNDRWMDRDRDMHACSSAAYGYDDFPET